jgi:hypothetical protein
LELRIKSWSYIPYQVVPRQWKATSRRAAKAVARPQRRRAPLSQAPSRAAIDSTRRHQPPGGTGGTSPHQSPAVAACSPIRCPALLLNAIAVALADHPLRVPGVNLVVESARRLAIPERFQPHEVEEIHRTIARAAFARPRVATGPCYQRILLGSRDRPCPQLRRPPLVRGPRGPRNELTKPKLPCRPLPAVERSAQAVLAPAPAAEGWLDPARPDVS